MRVVRPVAVLALLLAAGVPSGAQSAEAVARLEAARQAEPDNASALRSLGIAYYKQERFAEASAVLEQARRLNPKDGATTIYAGMSAERVPDVITARAAYNEYLEIPRPWYSLRARRTAKQVRNRVLALAHEESVARAKAAVAAEAQLTDTPGDPRTVAVPAMKYLGPSADLVPLERGLAELVITDLSKSSQLVLVERDRMQALADEIQLGASERVDAPSAARAGRLIQAGRLVNGSIIQGGNDITLSSNVVTVATTQISSPAAVTGTQDAFFDLEKNLVFRIFDQLGVTLTSAERVAIGKKETESFEAFLLFSRGLVATDAGQYGTAAQLFKQASALDPAFQAAKAQAAMAEAASAGAQITPAAVERALPRGEQALVKAAVGGAVPPLVVPPVLIPGIPSVLRLPTVPAAPIGSTLGLTAQSVNPPTVSPILSAATRSMQPTAPPTTATSHIIGGGQVTVLLHVVTLVMVRP